MITYDERKRVEILEYNGVETGEYGSLIGFLALDEYGGSKIIAVVERDDGRFEDYGLAMIRVIESQRIK